MLAVSLSYSVYIYYICGPCTKESSQCPRVYSANLIVVLGSHKGIFSKNVIRILACVHDNNTNSACTVYERETLHEAKDIIGMH